MKENEKEPEKKREDSTDEHPDINVSLHLFERYKKGEAGALDELFERHRPMLERVVRIRMFAKLRRHHEVDDLVQETLQAAWQSIDKFEPQGPGSFRAWLRKVAENAIRGMERHDAALKRGRDQLVSDASIGGDSEIPCLTDRAEGREPSPSQASITDHYKQLVDQALAKLPEHEREVVILRLFLDHPWAEIVKLLDGCPSEGAAQKLLERAKDHLNGVLHGRRFDFPTGLGRLPL